MTLRLCRTGGKILPLPSCAFRRAARPVPRSGACGYDPTRHEDQPTVAPRGGSGADPAVLVLLWQFLIVYSLTFLLFFVTGRYRVPLVPLRAAGAGVRLTASRPDGWRSSRGSPTGQP